MSGEMTVEDYMAGVPEPMRKALENLRATIKAAAPEAGETISYRMPAFRVGGRLLVSYAAFKDHFSLFPMSRKVIEDHAEDLKPYVSGRGTVRFSPDDPLPVALIQSIIRARLEENARRLPPRG